MYALLAVITILVFWPQSAGASTESLNLPVAPIHMLIVDNNGEIIAVVTNSGDSQLPIVRLESETGTILPYSPDIRKQYFALHALINYSFSGVVYAQAAGSETTDLSWWHKLVSTWR